jgi:ParB-like chromosome segregation protein Spo0J
MSLRLNPIYDKLLPPMTEEEFAELKISIETEGQHYPIIVNEDLEVLDGHHRFRACIELGIEPDFEVRKFDDKLLEKKFVIEANLRRRHLNNFQLVELAIPLIEIEKALAKHRQSKGGKNGRDLQSGVVPNDAQSDNPFFGVKATEVVAKKAGLSTTTFERGKKIIEKASEDDKQKLREGKKSIAKVYQEIVSSEKNPGELADQVKVKHESLLDSLNKKQLIAILEKLDKQELFCPECGNPMFECSKCHKTLKSMFDKIKKKQEYEES